MRKKEREQQEGWGSTGTASPRISPIDVQQKEFRLAFRGYKERDVDAFLDEITEELALYLEENRRLREGAPGAPPQTVAAPGVAAGSADAAREAEDILARAREEAGRIVRDAEARAAAAGVTSAPGDQGAVAPFLNKEREFLQSLAGLVQGHAESVKVMVKAHRERTSVPAPAAAVPAPSAAVRVPDAVEAATEAAPSAAPPLVSPEATGAAGEAGAPGEASRPARSLRELFWGED